MPPRRQAGTSGEPAGAQPAAQTARALCWRAQQGYNRHEAIVPLCEPDQSRLVPTLSAGSAPWLPSIWVATDSRPRYDSPAGMMACSAAPASNWHTGGRGCPTPPRVSLASCRGQRGSKMGTKAHWNGRARTWRGRRVPMVSGEAAARRQTWGHASGPG